jgi:ribosomal protein L7/L12
MTEVRLVGWSPGLKSVSLIKAICDHAGVPLREAKGLVEDLMAGHAIVVSFTDAARRDDFRELACRLGAQCE